MHHDPPGWLLLLVASLPSSSPLLTTRQDKQATRNTTETWLIKAHVYLLDGQTKCIIKNSQNEMRRTVEGEEVVLQVEGFDGTIWLLLHVVLHDGRVSRSR